MTGTHVRQWVSSEFAELTRDERIRRLRANMRELIGGAESYSGDLRKIDVVPVREDIRVALRADGLPRRAVTHVNDCPSLVIEIIAHAIGEGNFVAIVGWPELILTGVLEKYPQASAQMIVIPDPGEDPLYVLGVLAEGMDLIFYRNRTGWRIAPGRARPLLAKLKSGDASLVMSGAEVASPALTLHGVVAGFDGIEQGQGRIRGLRVRVEAEMKGYTTGIAVVQIGRPHAEGGAYRESTAHLESKAHLENRAHLESEVTTGRDSYAKTPGEKKLRVV